MLVYTRQQSIPSRDSAPKSRWEASVPRLQSRRGRGTRRPPTPEEQDVITPQTEAGPVRVLHVIHRSPCACSLGKGESNCSPRKPGAHKPPKARILQTRETQHSTPCVGWGRGGQFPSPCCPRLRHGRGTCAGPRYQAQKGHRLHLMLCFHHWKFLILFEQGACISFRTEPRVLCSWCSLPWRGLL